MTTREHLLPGQIEDESSSDSACQVCVPSHRGGHGSSDPGVQGDDPEPGVPIDPRAKKACCAQRVASAPDSHGKFVNRGRAQQYGADLRGAGDDRGRDVHPCAGVLSVLTSH
ncbi:hypothetical protein FI667_g14841, partial [Globisporangium splendens]